MADANGGHPLPWQDTAPCRHAGCGGSLVVAEGFYGIDPDSPGDARVACITCGRGWRGTRIEVVKARRAEAAWLLHQRGLVHEDRGCARCNAALMLNRERLCGPCVAADMRERQGELFAQHGGG